MVQKQQVFNCRKIYLISTTCNGGWPRGLCDCHDFGRETDEGMKRLIKAIYELDKKYKPLQGAYNTVDSDIVPGEIKKSQKKEKNYDIEPGYLPQAEVIYSPAQVISMKVRRGRWVAGCAIDTERRLHFRGVRVSLSTADSDAGAGGTDHSADPGTFSMVYGKNI